MPSTEQEDREAKRKAREARRSGSRSESGSRRESRSRREDSDRRVKDRARREPSSPGQAVTPGAVASTDRNDSSRSKQRSSRSSGGGSSSTPGAVASTDRNDSSRSKQRSSRSSGGGSSSNRDRRTKDRARRGGDVPVSPGAYTSSNSKSSRESRKAARASNNNVPGASAASPSTPSARKQRAKAGIDGSSRSTQGSSSAAAAAGLAAPDLLEDGNNKAPGGDAVGGNGEILVEALAVDEAMLQPPPSEPAPRTAPYPLPVPVTTPTEEPKEPPPPLPKKKRTWIIVAALLILGAGAGAGAYFGTQGSKAKVGDEEPPIRLFYAPPLETDCDRIAAGLAPEEPKDTVPRNYALTMQVELSSEESQLNLPSIASSMQAHFVTDIVGCSGNIVREESLIQIQYVIYSGLVDLQLAENASCQASSIPSGASNSCYVVNVDLAIELQDNVLEFLVTDLISEFLNPEGGLASSWQLQPQNEKITIVTFNMVDSTTPGPPSVPPVTQPTLVDLGAPAPSVAPIAQPTLVDSNTPAPSVAPIAQPTLVDSNTPAPSVVLVDSNTPSPTDFSTTPPTVAGSQNPSFAPVATPTTGEPTKMPTKAPTTTPSASPSKQPTEAPTPRPTFATGVPTVMTPQPTLSPSKSPTDGPSKAPTMTPSKAVSMSPSMNPTKSPTKAPSTSPSKNPTATPSKLPTKFPTPLPTPNPTACISPPLVPVVDRSWTGAESAGSHYVIYQPRGEQWGYVHWSEQDARNGCASIGMSLCRQSAAVESTICRAAWFADGSPQTIYYSNGGDGCGSPGLNYWWRSDAAAACCAEPYYLPENGRGTLNNPVYNTREEAQAACAAIGLGLCSTSQIMGYELCSYGWMSDAKGLYATSNCASSYGLHTTSSGFAAGAWCCVTEEMPC